MIDLTHSNKLSTIIKTQIPSYILEEYDVYSMFIKAYYEWLEEEDNPLEFLQTYQKNIDIDFADDDFVDMFVKEFVGDLPSDRHINDKLLVEIIKNFYRARGSVESFKFIFRVIFGADVREWYPKEYMFRSSNGNWTGRTLLYTTSINYPFVQKAKYSSIEVIGIQSGAVASINKATTKTTKNGTEYIEYDISSVNGLFYPEEQVKVIVDEKTVTETLLSAIVDFSIGSTDNGFSIGNIVEIYDSTNQKTEFAGNVSDITKGGFTSYVIENGGSGYTVGDTIYVHGSGSHFSAEVESVDSSGKIEKITILTPGYNYIQERYAEISSDAGSGASIRLTGNDLGRVKKIEIINPFVGINQNDTYTIKINGLSVSDINIVYGSVFNEKKDWNNIQGFTSFLSRLQDSFYYQDFSYVLDSDEPPQNWIEFIKFLCHPAGLIMFSVWSHDVINDVSLSPTPDIYRIVKMNMEVNPSVGFNQGVVDNPLTKRLSSESTCIIDNQINELDNIKFSDSFNWKIENWFDKSINTIKNSCSPMNQTIDTYITIS